MKVVPVGGEVKTDELFGCHMEESASIVKFINFVSVTKANYRTFLYSCSSRPSATFYIKHGPFFITDVFCGSGSSFFFVHRFRCLPATPLPTQQRTAKANTIKLMGDFIMPKKKFKKKYESLN